MGTFYPNLQEANLTQFSAPCPMPFDFHMYHPPPNPYVAPPPFFSSGVADYSPNHFGLSAFQTCPCYPPPNQSVLTDFFLAMANSLQCWEQDLHTQEQQFLIQFQDMVAQMTTVAPSSNAPPKKPPTQQLPAYIGYPQLLIMQPLSMQVLLDAWCLHTLWDQV